MGGRMFRNTQAGKAQSKRYAFAPSKATLVYDPERSVNADGTPSKPGESLQENSSQNLIIEGDNLEVLKLLQASYFEKVKCIYIDPPYNTGKDFIYPDDFSQSTKAYWQDTGLMKGGVRLVALPETAGKRHSIWLNMMQARLYSARQILQDEGIILVSIDDNEVANLRRLMDEVFGDTNFIAQISVQSNKRGQTYKDIAKTHEYVLVYSKTDDFEIYEFEKEADGLPHEDSFGKYDLWGLRNRNPKFNSQNRANLYYPIWVAPKLTDEDGFNRVSAVKDDDYCEAVLPLNSEGGESVWRWGKDKLTKNVGGDLPTIIARKKNDGEWSIFQKSRRDTTKAKTIWYETDVISEKGTVQLGELGLAEFFEHPKPIGLIKRVIDLSCEDGDIFLDFFAGSGTSGHAAYEYCSEKGKSIQTILVQVPEITPEKSAARKAGYNKISDLTIERLKRAGTAVRSTLEGTACDTGFRVLKLEQSHFPENTFAPDPEKSDVENLKALEGHLQAAAQPRLFGDDGFHSVVTEVALKNGFGLFYTLERLEAFTKNTVYRMQGNDKDAILCLDEELQGETLEALKTYSDNQLIVLKAALDTTKKFELQTGFQDNLWVI
jgi:adenine-specific DNA-methyltransferase